LISLSINTVAFSKLPEEFLIMPLIEYCWEYPTKLISAKKKN